VSTLRALHRRSWENVTIKTATPSMLDTFKERSSSLKKKFVFAIGHHYKSKL
jgi:hypothetical protein